MNYEAEATLAACPASLAPEAAVRLQTFFVAPDGLFAKLVGRHGDFKVARVAVGALFEFLLQHGAEAYAHMGEVRASVACIQRTQFQRTMIKFWDTVCR